MKSILQNQKTNFPLSEIRHLKTKIRNPLEIRSPKFEIRNQKSEIRHPKSEIRNQKSGTRNPNSEIRNQGRFPFDWKNRWEFCSRWNSTVFPPEKVEREQLYHLTKIYLFLGKPGCYSLTTTNMAGEFAVVFWISAGWYLRNSLYRRIWLGYACFLWQHKLFGEVWIGVMGISNNQYPSRCVYLSSIRFSSNNENWKLRSISVHLDWFHLKPNVRKKNQIWNKHFWSFNSRKITVKELFFYSSPFSFETQNKKMLSFFDFLTFHLNQTWKLQPQPKNLLV